MQTFEAAVFGDDMRQLKLRELLLRDGHAVIDGPCRIYIFPIPFSHVSHSDFLMPQAGNIVFAGMLPKQASEELIRRGVRVFDYSAREEYAVANAAICAEGAVQLAMNACNFTLYGADVMVMGFGRIGKRLSTLLKGLGANVTVSARKASDRQWIELSGCKSADFHSLPRLTGKNDIVFNTVPVPLSEEVRTGLINAECLYIELASKPGGPDEQTAALLGRRYIDGRGLPAKTAPMSAANALRSTVYNILIEENLI